MYQYLLFKIESQPMLISTIPYALNILPPRNSVYSSVYVSSIAFWLIAILLGSEGSIQCLLNELRS